MVDGVDNNGDNWNGVIPVDPARTDGTGPRGDADPATGVVVDTVTSGGDVELDETTRARVCDKV